MGPLVPTARSRRNATTADGVKWVQASLSVDLTGSWNVPCEVDAGMLEGGAMIEESEAQAQEGWLEIQDGGGSSQAVHCPHRGMINLPECLACRRCDGLAMDRDGGRIYVVCTPSDAKAVEQL